MNCDQAFDLLTSRAGVNSADLQEHLATCARCRSMQQTLSPALEALTPYTPTGAGSGSLKAGAVDLVAVANQATRQLVGNAIATSGPPPRKVSRWSRRGWSIAGILLLCGLAGYGGWSSRGSAGGVPTDAAQLMASRNCTWKSPIARQSQESARTVVMSCLACHLPAH